MDLLKDEGCFVCGPANPEGLRVRPEIDAQSQSAWCRLEIPARLQGWRGIAHGGIVATLLDEVCIYACRGAAAKLVTAELTVRYRRPVPVGEEVVVRAVVTGSKRRIKEVHAELTLGGELCAEADSKVFVLDQRL